MLRKRAGTAVLVGSARRVLNLKWRRVRRLRHRLPMRSGMAEALLVLLFAATISAVHFQESLLERRTIISPADTAPGARYAYGDESMGGGSAAIADGSRALAGSCVLRADYPYPFCGFGLILNVERPQQGLDLADGEEIGVDLTYRGRGELVRFTLKNNDPRYSVAGRGETDKINEVDIAVRGGRQTVVLTPSDFAVAEWWLQQQKLPRHLSETQFDNIVALELQTGADARLGSHAIEVHSITFTRRLFSQSALYAALIVAWVLAIAALVVQRRREVERVQRSLAERGHKILDAIPQMVWSATDAGYEYFNRQWRVFTGVEVGGAKGVKRLDLVHPDDRAAAAERWQRSMSSGEPYEAEYRLRHRSGSYRWVLSRGLAEKDAEGGIVCWYGTCTDIHERVLAAQALDESERLTRGVVSAIPDCVSLLDAEGRRLFVNEATVAAYKVASADELVGESWLDRMPEQLRERASAALTRAQAGEVGRATIVGQDRRWWDTLVAPVFTAGGKLLRIVVVSRDISERKEAEDRANWSAHHDALTRLPNRMLLQQRLEALADAPGDTAPRFALLLLDVDNFKRINDTAGHDAGDALLCAFAERLQSAIRGGDTVARLSGDEFAIVLNGVGTEGELRTALERIATELRKPCVHAGRVFDCNASIGAGIYGRHGATRAELLKNVDVALYAAKAAGKGTYKIFRTAMRNEMQKRSSMLSLAKDALAENRIVPFYQPKVALGSGRIVGFEALLRWRHPKKGVQPPATIAAAFEDLTLAAEISDQVIDAVLADLVRWRSAGIDVGHVAVNASAAEFRRGDFAERLLEKLDAARVPVSALQLEVTETVFLGRGAECVEHALKKLSAAGMKIALDDFGTGYASLSHLNQFPVNILKIDRSFVSAVPFKLAHAPIIDAVVNLGRSLEIEVVAEGIETQMQHDFLVGRGCAYGQGYLYSPAVPARRVACLLREFSETVRIAA
jgi:diguanylate cyclase (GGDEF)-like protein/PAS domain S-box-containing protein